MSGKHTLTITLFATAVAVAVTNVFRSDSDTHWAIIGGPALIGTVVWLRSRPRQSPLVQRAYIGLTVATILIDGLGFLLPGPRALLFLIGSGLGFAGVLVNPEPHLVALSVVTAFPKALPQGLTALAAALAGPRRASSGEAWRAHLLGDPAAGVRPSWFKQVRDAAGFLVAAMRMRGGDAWQQVCRPLDWAVATENRLAGVVLFAVLVPIVLLQHAGGWALVWDDWEKIGVCAAFAGGGAAAWRRMRGITPRKQSQRKGS